MSAKPTKLPEWASDGTQIVEPSAGKKANGHLSGEQPIPQYVNWLYNTTYQWCQFVDDLFGAGVTGDATMTGDLTVNGVITGGHPTLTVAIPASAVGMNDNSTSFTRGAGSMQWLGGHNAVAAAPLANGERVQAVRCYCADVSGSSVTVSLVSASHTGAVTTICSATSSGAGGNQTLTLTGGALPYTVAGALSLTFTTSGTGNITVYNVEIDHDRA